jgi:hypothetical protein
MQFYEGYEDSTEVNIYFISALTMQVVSVSDTLTSDGMN